MPRTANVTLPIPEPLALLDATLLFLIQVLLAQHPDLLAPPEEPAPRTPGLRAARRIFEAVRELHAALDGYRAFLPADHSRALGDERPGDDIPF
ncbi:hypothetical protein WME95_08665 [Sorangium sp. So ce327]|uniref:hypothetical protein n=1 Tax=unclassified Sorangium TaxID=2621164 RepID=UPI003F5B27FC